MFYSQYILTKRGPLAKIWLAAHMQNKLTKAMVFSIDLVKSCNKIINPDAPMALRLTSNLLLGVVRVYSRKARYLLSDCSDAVSKIKLAFRVVQAPVDLPEESETAQYDQVTLEEAPPSKVRFEEGAFDLSLDRMAQLQLEPMMPVELGREYQAEEEDITMPVTAGTGVESMVDSFGVEFEAERRVSLAEEEEMPLSFEPAVESPEIPPAEVVVPGEEEAVGPMLEVEMPEIPVSPIAEPEVARRVADRFSAAPGDITLGTETDELLYEDLRDMEEKPFEFSLPTIGEADITFDEEEGEVYSPPPGPPRAEEMVLPPSAVRPRRRRRPIAARFDRQTEIPAASVRAAMRDTSDVLRVPKRRRVAAAVTLPPPAERLLLPVVLEMQGPLKELYRTCMAATMPTVLPELMAPAAVAEEAVAEEPLEIAEAPLRPERETLEEVELAREERPREEELPVLTPQAVTPRPLSEGEKEAIASPVAEFPTPEEMFLERESLSPPLPPTPIAALPEVEVAPGEPTLLDVAMTQAEERTEEGRSARQERMLSLLQAKFASEGPDLNITEMLRMEKRRGVPNMRRTAARTFVELLSLSSRGDIDLSQSEPYGNVMVRQVQPFSAPAQA